MTLLRG